MGRKKIQSECEEKENPLELLPERRSKKIHTLSDKNVLKEKNNSEPQNGNEKTPLIQAINFLLTEVFYSHQQSTPIEEMKGDSILAKSLNYLFIDTENN